ncbi:flagellin [Brevibacillus borstelensis]|uniref:flagellin N-terminal helical domain-containing protein n=1 Tax=Brevibacillus borstelensis TaxID=45462 RepID=UPI001D0BD25B|nr:flagellin [Brevibacillus borstelensis]MCC0566449.1 flagellin [Brevibacillus borstelensis]MCM3559962.1 flagellin [Brevibacillus borstelensis]
MRINHNIASLNTYRQLSNNTIGANKALEKLSSGLRINRAGDDAAGLAISEKMRGQIRGLEMASKNAQDGISLIQTAEGALSETHSILQRMRELAVQAANDTNNDADRAELQKEVAQLKAEVDRIRDTTEFNTKKLLNGDLGVNTALDATNAAKLGGTVIVNNDNLANDTYKFDTGAANKITTTTSLDSSTIGGFTAAAGNFDLADTKTDNLKFGTYTLEAKAAGSNFDLTLKDVNGNIVASLNNADWKGGDVKLTGAGGVNFTLKKNASATAGEAKFSIEAKMVDNSVTLKSQNGGATAATLYTSTANETTKNGKLNLGDITIELDIESVQAAAAQVATSITVNNKAAEFQIGANQGQSTKLGIADMSTKTLGIDKVDISTRSGAQDAITKINAAIERVSSERSKLGAVQNRFEHTINNLGTSAENLTAAESRIRDVDMAKEMMEFTKQNILTQAAQAMLAQANQQPQGVLQLLR